MNQHSFLKQEKLEFIWGQMCRPTYVVVVLSCASSFHAEQFQQLTFYLSYSKGHNRLITVTLLWELKHSILLIPKPASGHHHKLPIWSIRTKIKLTRQLLMYLVQIPNLIKIHYVVLVMQHANRLTNHKLPLWVYFIHFMHKTAKYYSPIYT
jgi:hypothetical protein